MRTHDLKTWPEYFEAILSGAKTFEVRLDDRSYAVGDELVLEEFEPRGSRIGGGYTGRKVKRIISYKMPGGKFGLGANWCVLGLKEVQP